MTKSKEKRFEQEKKEQANLMNSLFDSEYYYQMYSEVREMGMDAFVHYDFFGWQEFKNPSIKFDTLKYLNENKDVKEGGMNPLVHYVVFGYKEGREAYIVGERVETKKINEESQLQVESSETSLPEQTKKEQDLLLESLFDAEYYKEMYPEVCGTEAFEHYDTFGWKVFKNPSHKFDTKKYLDENEDVREAGMNPLIHYITFGYIEEREVYAVCNSEGDVESNEKTENTNVNISSDMISSEYNTDSTDVIASIKRDKAKLAIENDFLLNFLFDEEYYLAENSDLKEADISLYEHFINYGWKENRNPSAYFNVNRYLEMHEDAKNMGINPLIHYVNYGRDLGYKLSTPTPPQDRFFSGYSELNVMHAGGSTAPEYAPCILAPVIKNDDAPKVIAFYLPQFHPFKENDAWWGKGFTEWTNVAKAIPQFEGHYQPRLPSDLGYYDLRLTEVMEEQVKMASAHGVDGFCFHYYWFAGHRLMERPLEQYLAEKENLDFPFSLCWANENWTRRWDGSEHDILMAQKHSKEDNEAVFYDLLRYFKDERYITVEGKPVLVIYRPDIIPDINGLASQLRALAVKEGFPGLHLVATNAFGFDQHKEVGFDAIVEFPPHNVQAGTIGNKVTLLNDEFSGNIFEYNDIADYSLARLHDMDKEVASSYYPTVMTGWDNSARKPGKGHVFHNATPAKFQRWLEGDYRWSQESHPEGAKFVFINAWNEWAEGTYLEPDKKFGYAYLNAIRSTINEVLIDAKKLTDFALTVNAKKQSDSVIVAHVFYEDLVDEICDTILEAKKYKQLDVAISIPNSFSLRKARQLVKLLKPVKLVVSENRGRDVWPFLQTLTVLKGMNYKYGCKIHSKKSTHLAKGDKWRQSMCKGLISREALDLALNKLAEADTIGIVAPSTFMFELKDDALRDNLPNLDKLSSIYDCVINSSLPFVGGTMFWFNFKMISSLMTPLANRELFGPELGAIDGTIAHAYERFIPSIAAGNGFIIDEYEIPDLFTPY
jgi:lipopolysaccharide biosynthesis protein